jgi:hypothetical protein
MEGHCDEARHAQYNMALGERRANAARDFLVSPGRADSRLLVTAGAGERPVASSNEAWAPDRRAVTVDTLTCGEALGRWCQPGAESRRCPSDLAFHTDLGAAHL